MTIEISSKKFCHKCHTVKPVSDYWACKRNKSGLQSYCKDCLKGYVKDNQARVNAYQAGYNATRRTVKG